jgi:hypothetical protein
LNWVAPTAFMRGNWFAVLWLAAGIIFCFKNCSNFR